MSKFRIRRGEWEIEYDGEDSSKKFEAILEWAKTIPDTARHIDIPETLAP